MGSADPMSDLAAYLRGRGVDPDVVAAAEAEGPAALRRLGYAQSFLGGPPTLRSVDVWERAGAPEDLARRLWRAMGFADLPDDLEALTDADVVALREINDYLALSDGGPEIAVRFTRLMGQAMGRVADALTTLVDDAVEDLGTGSTDDLTDGPTGDLTDDLAVVAAGAVIPLIEHELVYLLRRHLYAASVRRLAAPDDDSPEVTVGFADVVQFTRLSGQMAEGDLAELLEAFEAETTDIIAQHGARVVKLIGDAVMFVIDDPVAAASLALALVERFGTDDRPDLRVGLAHGPTISRQGDLFGPTVNLASRLVAFARPGTVLTHGGLADHLADLETVTLRPIKPRTLKGIGETRMFAVRPGTLGR